MVSLSPTTRGQRSIFGRRVRVKRPAQIANSKYDCPDAPLGNVDVAIQILQRTGKMVSEGGRSWPETRSLIADSYASGIKLEVTGDNSDQDFALTSK